MLPVVKDRTRLMVRLAQQWQQGPTDVSEKSHPEKDAECYEIISDRTEVNELDSCLQVVANDIVISATEVVQWIPDYNTSCELLLPVSNIQSKEEGSTSEMQEELSIEGQDCSLESGGAQDCHLINNEPKVGGDSEPEEDGLEHHDSYSDPQYEPQDDELEPDNEEFSSDSDVSRTNEMTASYGDLADVENAGEINFNLQNSASPITNPSTDTTGDTQHPKERKGRKRVRRSENWKCNVRKKCKLAGKEYITKKGKLIQAKQIKAPCTSSCKRKCLEKINPEARLSIFNDFWREENTNDFKRLYVASNVLAVDVKKRKVVPGKGGSESEPKTNRTRVTERDGSQEEIENGQKETEKGQEGTVKEGGKTGYRRNATLQYFFEVQGVRHQVCKIFFLNTLCISEVYVKTALAKKGTSGIVSPDNRGKKEPPNKLDDDIRESVRSHIRSFPVFESHYSRERSSRSYLGNHLSISIMYNMYIVQCQKYNKDDRSTAKEWLYHDIFNNEFNLGFKEPSNDTCDDCDEFTCKLRNDSVTEEERCKIQNEYNAHLFEADRRYKEKKKDKTKSKNQASKEKVIMFDLQKCLPTPHLSNASTFYLRKLWTYNLTILDVTENKAYCCMWDETVADRGSQEMSSCLLVWALSNLLDTATETLTIWTDNCGGQNRNFPMVVSYIWILKMIPNLKTINHKFLLKGHTHMGVDGVHSVIEKAKKKVQPGVTIAVPWDWQQFVRQCRFKELIHVYNMNVQDFKNFTSLFKGISSPLVKRTANTLHDKFLISRVVHFKATSEKLGFLYYRNAFDGDFQEVDLTRRTRGATWPEELPAIRSSSRAIAPEKYNDLQKLLKWVPPCFHQFYRNIPQKGSRELEKQRDEEREELQQDLVMFE